MVDNVQGHMGLAISDAIAHVWSLPIVRYMSNILHYFV